MANNNEQSSVIVHSDEDEQQPLAIPANLVGLLPIGPPPKHEPDLDDEDE